MSESSAYLVHSDRSGAQIVTALTSGNAVTLGRELTCDLVFDAPGVSREHARIHRDGDAFLLEDLGSKNGTYVNHRRILVQRLQDGDIITLTDKGEEPIRFTSKKPSEATRTTQTYDFSRSSLNDISNLKLLMQINRAISASIDLEEVVDLILQGVLRISGGARAMILLREKDGQLQAAYHKHRDGVAVRGSGWNYSTSVVAQVVRTRQPVLIHDLQQLPEMVVQKSIQEQSLESVVAIPLFSSESVSSGGAPADELIGVIYVDNQVARRAFTDQDVELLQAFSIQTAITLEKALLHRSLQDNYVQSVNALRKAVEVKDRYTGGHSLLVAQYALAIGEPLSLSEREYVDILRGGMLHDVGKIGIDGAVLNKPGRLTDAEYEIIKQHPTFGGEILAPISFMPTVNDIVLNHHQRLDGKGYPGGLKGPQLSLGVRLVAVADVFEAITADRAYRKAMPPENVVQLLEREAASGLDAELTKILLGMYRDASYDKAEITPRSESLQNLLRTFTFI